MSQDTVRIAEPTVGRQRVYNYRAGILRSIRERGGAASLGEVKGDIAGEAGEALSLQGLEDARQMLVSEGTLYTELRWIRGLRGIRKRAVFLVLAGLPRPVQPVIP
jgi:hypothetical protein